MTEADVRAAAKRAGVYVKREGPRGRWWAAFPGDYRSIGGTNAEALRALAEKEKQP